MPSCIINQCRSKSGRKGQNQDIIIHRFPRDINRIKIWLQNTGQEFEDIEGLASKINEAGDNNKYRLCSCHFSDDCYNIGPKGRYLKSDGIPTIFPTLTAGEKLIDESLKKDRRRSLKRVFEASRLPPTMEEHCEMEEECTSVNLPTIEKTCSVGTQTEYTLENSMVVPKPSIVHDEHEILEDLTPGKCAEPRMMSTPIDWMVRSKVTSNSEFSSPVKKRPHISVGLFQTEDEDSLEGIEPLSPIAEEPSVCEEMFDSTKDDELEDNGKDRSYIPDISNIDTTDQSSLNLLLADSPKIKSSTSRETKMVQEKKILIFESSLDILLYKVKCQKYVSCNSTVSSFEKIFEGTYCKVKGTCHEGHKFTVFESQPKIGKYSAGNILTAAAILFSGLNFQKVHELFNILGMVSISEKSYYRYQTMFLFPAIDISWKAEQSAIVEETKTNPLCIAGDGQCDSPGHCAKYCIYSMMDTVTTKIIDFEIVQRTQCPSSVAMEKHGFTIVMDRLINTGFNIKIFASDRHVGIRKKLRLDYPKINHQFDVWHYAKSLKKKLSNASRQKFCKEITPWISKIVLHFWWSIQTCNANTDLLREKWFSLLHHIVNRHHWNGTLYSNCSHGEMEEKEETVFWLNEETPPFTSIQKIVTGKAIEKDLPHLSRNCHTGHLENFHSLALKYRTKRIHFAIDAMEARTKLAALTHNKNVGRDQAVVKVSKRNTEAIGTKRTCLVVPKGSSRWIVRDVFEKVSVDYLEDICVDVLKLVTGELKSNWTSRAPSLPPNILNRERPNKEDIKRQRLSRFKATMNPDNL